MKLILDLASLPHAEHWTKTPSSPVIFLSYLKRTPPHIAMVFNNHYYSYDLQKFDKKVSLEKVLIFFEKKNESVLGIILKKHPVYSLEYLEETYSMWTPENCSNPTCLSPVLDFMNLFYPFSIHENKRLNIPEFLNLVIDLCYADKMIFHKFNQDIRILEFENYNPADTKELIEKVHVSERQ